MMRINKSALTLDPYQRLDLGGLQWDLSNLCGNPDQSRRRVDGNNSLPIKKTREYSLYPSTREISSSFCDVNIEEEFAKASQAIPAPQFERTPSLPMRKVCPTTESQAMSPSRQEEFKCPESRFGEDVTNYQNDYGGKPFASESQAMLPGRHEEFKCPESRFGEDVTNYQNDYGGKPFASPCASPYVDQYRPKEKFERITSSLSFASPKPAPVPPRLQVEISPGEFMNLRGAAETAAAIERGRSKLVFCLECGAGLRCVADCQLVLCPDCRIMSPVPRRPPTLMENGGREGSPRNRKGIPSCPSIWGEEESDVGGLGLGVKIGH
jgi:hypothetical protein